MNHTPVTRQKPLAFFISSPVRRFETKDDATKGGVLKDAVGSQGGSCGFTNKMECVTRSARILEAEILVNLRVRQFSAALLITLSITGEFVSGHRLKGLSFTSHTEVAPFVWTECSLP